jgi:type IV fimbrial biogenesis protein FimT
VLTAYLSTWEAHMAIFGWQNHHRRHLKRIEGFVSVELLAALISSLFILHIGLPVIDSLTDQGKTHLLEQTSLASHLEYARSEAIRRQTTVTVCPSENFRSCLRQGEWQQGWIIFTDDEGPTLHLSVGDKMLHNQKGMDSSDATLAYVNIIRYQADGSILLD